MKPNKMLVASCNGDMSMAKDLEIDKNEVHMWFVVWENTATSTSKRRMEEIQLADARCSLLAGGDPAKLPPI